MQTAKVQMSVSMQSMQSDLDILLQYPLILKAGHEGPDQPAHLCRLIRACMVRKVHKGPFRAFCIICLTSS